MIWYTCISKCLIILGKDYVQIPYVVHCGDSGIVKEAVAHLLLVHMHMR